MSFRKDDPFPRLLQESRTPCIAQLDPLGVEQSPFEFFRGQATVLEQKAEGLIPYTARKPTTPIAEEFVVRNREWATPYNVKWEKYTSEAKEPMEEAAAQGASKDGGKDASVGSGPANTMYP